MDRIKHIDNLSKLLLDIDNAIIITHERPDGDAFGSVIALLILMNALEKNVAAYFPEEVPERYRHLGSINNVFIQKSPQPFGYTSCICLDCGNKERLATGSEDIHDKIFSLPIINIDHHHDNTLYGQHNYIDSKACSTAEIIFDIFQCSDRWEINPQVATAITMGMLMDTGGFRFDNTTPDVLRKAAALMELGSDYSGMIKAMYFTKPFDSYRLEADIALNYLKRSFDNRFVYLYLNEKLLKKYNINKRDTEGLIDSIRIIGGVDITAILIKKEEGFRVSLRSNNSSYSVAAIAHRLNGGGHKLAAGCLIEKQNIKDAEKVLLHHVENVLSCPGKAKCK